MFIEAVGMVCPVGLSAVAACAAKRAGISGFRELRYRDNGGESIIGAVVPYLPPTANMEERMLQLLSSALVDVMGDRPRSEFREIPLLVGVAESDRPGGSRTLADTVVSRVETALGVRFHPQWSVAFPHSHTAGFRALRFARDLLRKGSVSQCIVCGVDSMLNAMTLSWLDRTYRLKTPGNRDGVIPGEAAAAVLVRESSKRGAARVLGLGVGEEPVPILSDAPLLGHGLTTAGRSALAEARLRLDEIDMRVSDVTGELYGFKELPLMEARLMRVVRKQPQPIWHWAESIGDTGAAAGPAQLVLLDQAFRKGYAPGQRAICLTSSPSGDRAVAVVIGEGGSRPARV